MQVPSRPVRRSGRPDGRLPNLTEQQCEKNLPPGATLRKPLKTAADLYDFISKQMPLPKGKAGSPSAESYWR